MKTLKMLAAIAAFMIIGTAGAEDYRSSLVRTYSPPVRIVQTGGNVSGVGAILSNPESSCRPFGQSTLTGKHTFTMKNGTDGGNAYIILDYGRELHGGLRFVVVNVSDRPKVRIRYGESVSETCSDIGQDGATNDHAMRDFETVLPRYGVLETGNSGFRFVRIDLLGENASVQIRSIDAVKVDSPYEQKGSFRCSDPRLDSIWETGRHTVKLNMQDYLWDGIKRDRLVWIGDMYPEVMTICAAYGDVDIVPRSLDFATEDYKLPAWINGIGSYSMWWILIQYQWYLHTGDLEYLKTRKDYLFPLLRQLASDVDSAGNVVIPGRQFLDWPSNGDENAINTGLHALMMISFDYGAKLSAILHDDEMVSLCRETYSTLSKAAPGVRDRFFAEKVPADRVGRKQAVALMSLAGILDGGKAASDLTFNGPHGFSTFYGSYMLEALAKSGHHSDALDIIREYWGGMLDLGATSFWEDFDIDWMKNAGRIDRLPEEGKVDVHRSYGGYCYQGLRHSFCHGWASGPTSWMTRHVLGLRPASPGQDTVLLDPHLCGLEWAEGTYPTPKGIISVRLTATAEGVMARVDAPEGVTIVPSDGVTVNECTIDSSSENIDHIRQRFTAVPRKEVSTGVYWYWINDNVTEEGVTKDLEAMKKVGIDRVQVGNIQSDGVPSGDAVFFSDKWWNVTRTAMKKAAELGIEFGEFNSPGWSQSGGPWVKPEQAMRYVAFKDTVIRGGGPASTITLPDVNHDQIIDIQAYKLFELAEIPFTVKADSVIELKYIAPIDLRTISVSSSTPLDCNMKLMCNGNEVKSFRFDRGNRSLNVGFLPDAPVVVSVPETHSYLFTLVLDRPVDATLDIVLSERVTVDRFAEKTLARMCPHPAPLWEYYMWEAPYKYNFDEGVVDASSIVSLKHLMTGSGSFQWNVPEGPWKISVAYMKPTGVRNSPATAQATGLEVDKLSRKHIRHHFDSYLGDMLKRIPYEDRGTFDLSIMDSYEMGGQNWTDDMAVRFRDAYGYDPMPYLPALEGTVVDSQDKTDRFLWDLRRLVADMVATEYVGGLSEVCHENGLQSWLECYGHWGFPSEFLLYGGMSDQIAGEFWSEGTLGDIENRAASSCGHIYGKNAIWSESCTSGGPQYHRTPRMMKQRIDRFFTEGINNTLFHLYISQPDDRKPGIDAWFGNEFNRCNTWFSSMDIFIDYIKRCNYMLQRGRYVAQAAYFIGEDAPKMTGECNPALPKGYSFDYINADVLKNHAHVENRRLVLDSGMQYDILVLPNQTTMRPELLECIARFVNAGLTVTGPKPFSSPSLQNWPMADSVVHFIADSLWDSGIVVPAGTPLQRIFDNMDIAPDFSYTGEADIRFIHRTIPGEAEIYFLSNQNDSKASISARFDVPEGLSPQIWNPVDGSVTCLQSGPAMDIALDSLQSIFVVFRPLTASSPAAPVTFDERKMDSPWTVTFRETLGNPAFTITCEEPSDWSLSDDERIRYFSGMADYTNAFTLSAKEASSSSVVLDLGNVSAMCKVRINGTYVGGLWTPPYSIPVTGYVRQGRNTVEIEVVNNWQNRLVGDSRLPAEQRGTWTNINPWDSPDKPLQSSGITCPVRIRIAK